MSNETDFIKTLSEAGGPLCDDCLAPAAGWNQRQQANQVGRRLEARGAISRPRGQCVACRKMKTVSVLGGGSAASAARRAPGLVVPGPSPAPTVRPASPASHSEPGEEREWYWEGHVQAAVVAHLSTTGWRVTQVTDTASKAQGVDIVARKDGRDLWVTVKGYPRATSATNPSTQARHWFSQALFDVVRYRTERPDIAIGVALPDGFTSYLNLQPTVEWLHGSAPFVYFWAGEDGSVREA